MAPTPLAARVKAARAKTGLSQSQLAERSGVPLKTLVGIEQGVTLDPKSSTLLAVAKALGVAAESLFP